MKTLVFGDLHLDTLYQGYLSKQIEGIAQIIDLENPDRVVFLGDIFNKRKPTPEVLLGFKYLLKGYSDIKIDLLRGNHDSSTKADDGVTALTLYDIFKNVRVHSHYFQDPKLNWVFLPHYEDSTKVKAYLTQSKYSPGWILFGHFGYKGFKNSFGDYDSSIDITDFNNTTVLGHIHEFNKHENVTLLGTPYPTQFSEYRNEHYYLIIENEKLTYKPCNIGPKYYQVGLDEVYKKSFSRDRLNLVRVLINKFEDKETVNLKQELLRINNVDYVEIKYYPSFEEEDKLSKFDTSAVFTEVDDDLIAAYIAEAQTDIPKEDLLNGLEILKNDIK